VSTPGRPERAAFEALRSLVRALQGELAIFRRRALQAEARVRELEAREGPPPQVVADPGLAQRIVELERENAVLHQRIGEATARTEAMLERVRFLRQQVGVTGP
jgi:hypothetical protein